MSRYRYLQITDKRLTEPRNARMLEKRRGNLNIVARLVYVISFYPVARLAVNNEPPP